MRAIRRQIIGVRRGPIGVSVYLPPHHSSVNFNFTKGDYVPPSEDEVNFIYKKPYDKGATGQ